MKLKIFFSDIEIYLKKSQFNLNVLGEIITDKYTYCEASELLVRSFPSF